VIATSLNRLTRPGFVLAALLSLALLLPHRAAASVAGGVAAENRRPGRSDWLIPRSRQDEIAGFADELSYLPGETVTLCVDSHGAPFTYRVFRLGFYRALGGREVRGDSAPIANASQPAPKVEHDHPYEAKLLTTGWHASARLRIPADWISGFYLVRLRNTATGGESYASFVVRSEHPAPIVIVLPTNTWEAYNDWGGLSLYRDKRGQQAGMPVTTARSVSFLRPWSSEHGAGKYFFAARPLVEWLESRGYPVSYATDRDALEERAAGPQTRLVILPNHTEYNDRREIDYYQRLVRQGISLAILGGNSFVWRAQFRDEARIETVWRDPAAADPDGDGERSTRWEWLGWPQNQLTGEMQVWGKPGPLVAVATGHWAWAGVKVSPGHPVGRVLGNEEDGVVLNSTTPHGLTVLARARIPSPSLVARFADMTIVDKPNGAFVFNAGDTSFTWNLSYPSYPGVDPTAWIGRPTYPRATQVHPAMQRLLRNLTSHAERIPDRAPPRNRIAPASPFRILSPLDGHVVPAGQPSVVVWTGAPRSARSIRITADRRPIATVPPATSTWTWKGFTSPGRHRITLVALDADGRPILRRRTSVDCMPWRNPIFQTQPGLNPGYAPFSQSSKNRLRRAWS